MNRRALIKSLVALPVLPMVGQARALNPAWVDVPMLRYYKRSDTWQELRKVELGSEWHKRSIEEGFTLITP